MKRALSLVFILILLLSISSTVFSETGQFNAVYLTKIYFNQWNKDDETWAMYAAHFLWMQSYMQLSKVKKLPQNTWI